MVGGEVGPPPSGGQAAPVATASEERRQPAPKAAARRDLTEGSIPKTVWSLSWVQMIEGVLNAADQLADLVRAGHIGAKSLAGLGAAQVYANLPMTSRTSFDIALPCIRAALAGRMGP